MNLRFTRGMKVVKMFYGLDGYRQAAIGTVTKISRGVVYVDDQGGITYSTSTGCELENFIPGMRSEITPLDDTDD